jgi:mycolic acid cyclopropane synthetase
VRIAIEGAEIGPRHRGALAQGVTAINPTSSSSTSCRRNAGIAIRFDALACEAGFAPVRAHAFGDDYAETLRRWLAACEAEIDAVQAQGFDDALIQRWRFCLAHCIAGFASDSTDVAQCTLAAR